MTENNIAGSSESKRKVKMLKDWEKPLPLNSIMTGSIVLESTLLSELDVKRPNSPNSA